MKNSKEYNRLWYEKNKEKKAEYYRDNKEKIVEQRKSETAKKKRRLRYLLNREKEIERSRKWAIDNKRKRADSVNRYFRTNNGGWRTYRSVAKRRGFEFTLTLEEYSSFRDGQCYYCGDKMEYIGLDRIDSSKGYSLANVVKCCKWCNTMKNTYSKKDFLEHCIKIVENLK